MCIMFYLVGRWDIQPHGYEGEITVYTIWAKWDPHRGNCIAEDINVHIKYK